MTEAELERRARRKLAVLRHVEEVSGNVAATSGPAKIAMYLARYHDVTSSTSGVWRILKRLKMNRLPASQRYQRHERRWKRYEKQRPGHQLQVDVKFIEPLGQKGMRRKKFYQFTAIDDCTRLRVLRAYPRCDQKTAIAFIDHTLSKLPFAVERVQTDMVSSSARRSTGTCSTKASTTSRSNPEHPG
jgi:hypothetical protein